MLARNKCVNPTERIQTLMPKTLSLALTPIERRASFALAGLFAARMLGLFLLLPVFAVAAQSLTGGDDPARVGLALGMYVVKRHFFQQYTRRGKERQNTEGTILS